MDEIVIQIFFRLCRTLEISREHFFNYSYGILERLKYGQETEQLIFSSLKQPGK